MFHRYFFSLISWECSSSLSSVELPISCLSFSFFVATWNVEIPRARDGIQAAFATYPTVTSMLGASTHSTGPGIELAPPQQPEPI